MPKKTQQQLKENKHAHKHKNQEHQEKGLRGIFTVAYMFVLDELAWVCHCETADHAEKF